ncbi:MAG: aldo/keto reductase [Candidatus Cloacimonetes bacterium]|nr:aldo/keto reductase [Candidatus Cloacimonadota bacterium]
MQYRKMPNSPDFISSLGFGCMRFPTNSEGKIDEEKSLEMLHYAYKKGINYYDSAWAYHNGESEPLLGKFITEVDRKKIYVATKLPCWLIKSREDMDEYLNKQLERLQTDYIDYYLLHSLNKKSWSEMQKHGVIDFLERAKADGKIRFAGFSFHDHYPIFAKITKAYDWDFTQIMLNYLDTHYQAGLRGYRLAMEKGMGVISMEPLRGGKLVTPIPAEVEKIWKKSRFDRKAVDRALRWLWNLEGVTIVLSGMSSMNQLQENIHLVDQCHVNELDEDELQIYKKARREYIKRIVIPCTECRYCLPCPAGVGIPFVLGMYNEAIMFNDKERHKKEYFSFLPEAMRADKCTRCGECLPKCPQKIKITDEMKKIDDYFKD